MVTVKKYMVFLLPFLFLASFAQSALVFADAPAVFDEAGLLTQEEISQLEEEALALGEEFGLDLVFVTTDNVKGMSSADYAGDFYDSHARGYGDTSDGILYLLNMEDREVYIYTRDGGYDYLPDENIDYMLDQVYPYLGDEDYSGSMYAFLDELEWMMDEGAAESGSGSSNSGIPDSYGYSGDDAEKDSLSDLEELGLYLLAALAAGGIVVGVMAMNNKGRPTVNEETYLVRNSFEVTKKIDRHYNTIVTQQHIPKNPSGGGGGGGGARVGGGGRGF